MFRKMIRNYFKGIQQEALEEAVEAYLNKTPVVKEKIQDKKIVNAKYANKTIQLLEMHKHGFKSMSFDIKYTSKFGTSEEHRIGTIQEILNFDMSMINDEIIDVKELTAFFRSFHIKDRLSCCNLAQYGCTMKIKEAQALIDQFKKDLMKFPELIL